MDPNLDIALKEKEPVTPDINQDANLNYVDPNLNFDQKNALLKTSNQAPSGEREGAKSFSSITKSFIPVIAPYIAGREGAFRTPSFTALDQETKKGVYTNMQGTITSLGQMALDPKPEILEWLKSKKIDLVGEAGISYEDGYLNIGPGVSKNEIIDFVKAKFAEEQANSLQNTADLAEPVVPEPTVPTVPDITPEPEPVINLNQTPADQVPDMAPQSNPNRVGIWQSPKPFSADDLVPPAEPAVVEDMSEIINEPTNNNKQPETPSTKEFEGKYPGDIKEWQELESLRNHLARLENQKNTSVGEMVNLDDFRVKYKEKKEKLAAALRESLTGVSEGPLSQEQQKLVNDSLFDELVVKENEAYLKALEENRSETLKDKAKEALRTVAGLKAVSWYLKQNKWVRLGITTGIATGVGVSLGGLAAGGAVLYGGQRLVRGVASLGASGLTNKYLQNSKKFSIDEVNKLEEQKVEEIKNSNKSIDEMSKELEESKKGFDAERRKRVLAKAAITIGAGSAAGLMTGFAEYMIGGPSSVQNVDQSSGKSQSLDQNLKTSSKGEIAIAKPKIAEVVPVEAVSEPSAPVPEVPVEPSAPENVVSAFKPEDLVHEVKAGDSTWKILQNTLETKDQFKQMTEAQKNYVLSMLTNKVLKNPEMYHIKGDGSLGVGDKTDFTNLFKDTNEIQSIINKAKQTITEGSAQEKSIIENNIKITKWIEANPNKSLNQDALKEILDTKTDSLVLPKPEKTPIQISVDEGLERLKSISPEIPNEPPAQVDPSLMEVPKKPGLSTEDQKAALQEDILLAKNRLAVLAGGAVLVGGRDRLRTMTSDTSVVAQTAEMNQMVDLAFKNEINDIYGESKLLGLKKIAGVDTKEWKTIARLPANKVLEYFRSPETSDLPKAALQELQLSEKHRKLVEHVAQLVEAAHKNSNADFKPYDNGENTEEYIKRIGTFLIKRNLSEGNNLNKAA